MEPITAMILIFGAAMGVGYNIEMAKAQKPVVRKTVIEPRTTCLKQVDSVTLKIDRNCYPLTERVE